MKVKEAKKPVVVEKKDIVYFPSAKATCACGAVMTVGSTRESIEVEICSQCHPLFTGKEKMLDTAGRVERFKARQATATKKTTKKATVKSK